MALVVAPELTELDQFVEEIEEELPGSAFRAARLLRGVAVFATIDGGDFPNKKALRATQERFAARLLLRRLGARLLELALGFSNEGADLSLIHI